MIRMTGLLGLGLSLFLSFGVSPVGADVILSNIADTAITSNTAGNQGGGVFGLQNRNATQFRIGRFNPASGNVNIAGVFVFVLPDLGNISDPFGTANLEFTLNRSGQNLSTDAPTFNADLYGIDRRASTDVIGSEDFFFGPTTAVVSDPDATFLEQDILTPEDTAELNEMVDGAELGLRISSGDISTYLNDQYESGAGIGEAVFLRLNADAIPLIATNNALTPFRDGYLVASAESDEARQPVINFTAATAVPEPAVFSILLLGAAAVSSRRKRNR